MVKTVWEITEDMHTVVCSRGSQEFHLLCPQATAEDMKNLLALAGELSAITVLNNNRYTVGQGLCTEVSPWCIEAAVELSKKNVPEDIALASTLYAYYNRIVIEPPSSDILDMNEVFDSILQSGCAIQVDKGTGVTTFGLFVVMALRFGVEDTAKIFSRSGASLRAQERVFYQYSNLRPQSFSSIVSLSDRAFNAAASVFKNCGLDGGVEDLIVDLSVRADVVGESFSWKRFDSILDVRANNHVLVLSDLDEKTRDTLTMLSLSVEKAFGEEKDFAKYFVEAMLVSLYTHKAIEDAINILARSYGERSFSVYYIAAVLLYADGEDPSEYDLVALPYYGLED